MTKEELFLQADVLKKDGDFLLHESNLITHLSLYGDVHISGSYSVDLMVNGDIDLYVVLGDFKKEKVVEILNKLIEEDYFRGFYFGDYIKHPKAGFPSGYYLGLNNIYREQFWKFDLWFVKNTDEEKDSFMKTLKENLTEQSRYEILKRKQERNAAKSEISSYEIYKQVLVIGNE
jgi:hypothetical protein